MLELIVCSLLTLFPDFLYRRFVQGKRLGKEITIFSVWFELRWGITTCLILTISLITAVFYFHPATVHASAVFRSVPILPQTNGRVAEIFIRGSQHVELGQTLFRLADETQRSALESARRAIAEVDAAAVQARADLARSAAQVLEAQGMLRQATDEFETRSEVNRRAPDVVARREIERLAVQVQTREAGVEAARAAQLGIQARIDEVIPAQRASAEAALAQAQAELDKTVIRAGVAGRVEQFLLQVGDIVNPLMRPAGVLVPDSGGLNRPVIAAGFGQIESQVMRAGMFAEVACSSIPWRVVPAVVTNVQGFIAAGQLRSSDQLIDLQQFRQPGTVLVLLEPLYENGFDAILPGSSCMVNAYTTNHEALADPRTGTGRRLVLHGIDTIGLVHAILMRIQVALLPFTNLVLSGH